jgi:acetyl esterase/lipase
MRITLCVAIVVVLSGVVSLRAAEPPAATAAAASQPAPATTMPAWTRTKDVIYGRTAATALTLDVFTPKEIPQNGAAVIIVVSGGWASSHEVLDSPMVGLFIGPFVRHGYTVFGVVPGSQPKFTIPEIAANVDKSVKFIRSNAERFKIDGDKIGITGGSAGGHLSLLQATRPSAGKKISLDAVERASGHVQAAAVLFPPTDFLNYRVENRNILDDPALDPFYPAFDFREMDSARHRLAEVTHRRQYEILKDCSPAQHVSKDTPPCLIIHGDKDELVPIQQARWFLDKLKAAGGGPGELVVKEGAAHGWGNADVEIAVMAKFFDKHLLRKAEGTADERR